MGIKNEYGSELSLSINLLTAIEVSPAPLPKSEILYLKMKLKWKIYVVDRKWGNSPWKPTTEKILNLSLKKEAGKQKSMCWETTTPKNIPFP